LHFLLVLALHFLLVLALHFLLVLALHFLLVLALHFLLVLALHPPPVLALPVCVAHMPCLRVARRSTPMRARVYIFARGSHVLPALRCLRRLDCLQVARNISLK
jgi:hypothetical protein